MASPSGSRSGDITLDARFFRCSGVETTVHEDKRKVLSARSLKAKDMSVNVGAMVCALRTLKGGFHAVMALNFLKTIYYFP